MPHLGVSHQNSTYRCLYCVPARENTFAGELPWADVLILENSIIRIPSSLANDSQAVGPL